MLTSDMTDAAFEAIRYAREGADPAARTAAREVVAGWGHAVAEVRRRHGRLVRDFAFFFARTRPGLTPAGADAAARDAARMVFDRALAAAELAGPPPPGTVAPGSREPDPKELTPP